MGLRATVAHICLLHFIKIKRSLAVVTHEIMALEIALLHCFDTVTCGFMWFYCKMSDNSADSKILRGFLGHSLQLLVLQH